MVVTRVWVRVVSEWLQYVMLHVVILNALCTFSDVLDLDDFCD